MNPHRNSTDAECVRAKAFRAQGLRWKAIAKNLGHGTGCYWCNAVKQYEARQKRKALNQ